MLLFVINSILLGVGLAMDAFSVSVTDGMREPAMSRRRMLLIAGTYAVFQFAMPLTGWFFVHTLREHFEVFQKYIPWIAFALLAWIGGKMLAEGFAVHSGEEEVREKTVTAGALLIQGIATSIDALSVGFTIADYGFVSAFSCALIIAAVTLVICVAGVLLGRRVGTVLNRKATILGGVILVSIGLEILIKHLL